MIKKYPLLCVCLTILFCAANLYSQGLETEIKVSPGLQTDIQVAKPDLSGKWILNLAKTNLPRNNPIPENLVGMSSIMVIEQKLPAIAITMRAQRGTSDDANFFGGRFTLYSDGRGDECLASLTSSTTRWQGTKLITTNYRSEDGRKEVDSIYEFELSTDGKALMYTLKHTERRLNAKGEIVMIWDDSQTKHLIYDRVK